MNKENRQKMNEIKLAYTHKKCPNVPIASIPKFDKNDNNTNGLTNCILAFLKYRENHAERINISGRLIKGKYIKSTMQKGTADISATIKGMSVKIEIKYGKDVQSEAQKKYQQQITDAGGIYYIARNFDDFIIWYNATFYPTAKKI